ncbi:MAG TPA: AAA family ATPase [Aequorivita sp.]|nr:AAA family ATPase [Aequorivita sp.]
MEIKKAEFIDGIYTWDYTITEEEWVTILQDKHSLKDETKSILYKFFIEPEHRSTCRKISEKHNITAEVIQKNIVDLGKIAQKRLNRFQVIGSDKEPTYWIIPMYGQLINRTLEWVIRPELISAMKTLYVDGNPSQERTLHVASKIKQSAKDKEITNFSLDNYVELLRSSKNLVLTGIIGTGKTYLARKIAKKMNAETKIVRLHAAYSYSDFIEGIIPSTWGEHNPHYRESLKDGEFTVFCKEALQNLIDSNKTKKELEDEKSIYATMTLFVEKIRDEVFETGEYVLKSKLCDKSVTITDINRNGFTVNSTSEGSTYVPWGNMVQKYMIFKEHSPSTWPLSAIEKHLEIYHHHHILLLFLKAFDSFQKTNLIKVNVDTVKKKDFVFIMDEMNNVDVTQIFGEVCASIAPEKRGPKGIVRTKLDKLLPGYDLFYNGFYIPENVYIIGTMNDVNSEGRSLGFDFIRKFTWKEIRPIDRLSMWDELIPTYKKEAYAIMTTINNTIDSIPELNELYHIGPSYFLKLKDFEGNFEMFWNNYLEGILTRYLINQSNHTKIIAQLKDACLNQKQLIAV